MVEGPPKSAASRRTVALDRCTDTILRAHRRRQQARYTATGRVWHPDGYVFTRADGSPYHPNYFTHRLRQLVLAAGLPRCGCTTCATARPASPSALAST